MLDLTKLATQMQALGHHLAQETTAGYQRLERVWQLVAQAQQEQADLVARRQEWGDRMGFAAAEPVEALNTSVTLSVPPNRHTVFATDGSQIAPSHHEIAYCYLINTGRVVLHYGQQRVPVLDSVPEMVYRTEDLYLSRQWGIPTEEWMGYRRTVCEATVLSELACQWRDSQRISGVTKTPIPALALVDGSLLYWFLETLPTAARDRILLPILQSWDQLRLARVPLVGYTSAPRSREMLNFLRLKTCIHPEPDCGRHCDGQTERAPCQVFDPLRDSTFWATQLEPGQRSGLWRSTVPILKCYGPHHTYFCYVHMGVEIARLDFPAWVAEDSGLLDLALSLTLTQVYKGYGYPVALAEAHNQAVVRGGDRLRFFALLEQQLIRAGVPNVGISSKEVRKRGSIA